MTVRYHDVPGTSEEGPGGPGPGHRLREARAAAKLSLDGVASRLRLDRRTVDALERDDYTDLPEATFVRGYLRGYARLLDLPPGPIVEAYDRLGYTPPDLVPDISSRPQVRSTDMPVRLVTYAVVGVLVALGVIWWQSERGSGPIPLDLAGQTASPAPERADTVTATAVAADPAKPGGPPPASQARTPAPAPPPAAPVAPPASVAAPPPRTPDPRSTPAPSGTPATAPVPAPPAPAATGPSGADRLVLRLKHDSWVEVYERGGKRVFSNMARSGQTLSLTGTPPFRVILGYARDAQVEYNGQPFDTAPFTAKDIARFSVGG